MAKKQQARRQTNKETDRQTNSKNPTSKQAIKRAKKKNKQTERISEHILGNSILLNFYLSRNTNYNFDFVVCSEQHTMLFGGSTQCRTKNEDGE